jgi:carbamoyl-phosphate synthase large subunit
MDVDLVEHEGSLYVLDLNVRFGGAHIFSLYAGARVPDAMVAWRQGRPHEPRWLTHEPGLVLSRFKSVCRLELGA